MFKKSLVASAVLALSSSAAFAGGFSLDESSTSNIGMGYAAGTVGLENASGVAANPAVSSEFKRQELSIGVHVVAPDIKIKNASATVTPPGVSLPGETDGRSRKEGIIPSFSYVKPINDKMGVGVSMTAPFGLKTSFGDSFVGRIDGTTSAIEAVRLTGSVSYKVAPNVSLGAGVFLQRFDADLRSGGAAPGSSGAILSGADNGFGFQLGALWKVDDATNVGVAYTSKVKHELKGNAILAPSMTIPTGYNAGVKADVSTPDSLRVSASHKFDERFTGYADVAHTRWDSIDVINFRLDNGGVLPSSFKWKNTTKVSLGGVYKLNDAWKVRAGVMYDESPVPQETKSVRLPDNDRTWVTVGGTYTLDDKSSVDMAYGYAFIKDSTISHNSAPGVVTSGDSSANAQVLSVSYNYKF